MNKDACASALAASGHGGLIVKSFDAAGDVDWQKPAEGEEDNDGFLARVYQKSIDIGVPGLAWSASGSLGLVW